MWSKDVPQKSKGVLHQNYYVPILTYASETWVTKKKRYEQNTSTGNEISTNQNRSNKKRQDEEQEDQGSSERGALTR